MGSAPWLHSQAVVNGIQYHWVEAGRRQDPILLLLHGLGEFWYAWASSLRHFAALGYRVIAPDLRGYNLTDKPSTGHELETLTADIYELLGLLATNLTTVQGTQQVKVTVVGHDLGASIALRLAAQYPHKVQNLVCLHRPRLRLPWWWQLPCLSRLLLQWNRCWLLVYWLNVARDRVVGGDWEEQPDKMESIRSSSHQQEATQDYQHTAQLYRDAASQPGALRCMLSFRPASAHAASHPSPHYSSKVSKQTRFLHICTRYETVDCTWWAPPDVTTVYMCDKQVRKALHREEPHEFCRVLQEFLESSSSQPNRCRELT